MCSLEDVPLQKLKELGWVTYLSIELEKVLRYRLKAHGIGLTRLSRSTKFPLPPATLKLLDQLIRFRNRLSHGGSYRQCDLAWFEQGYRDAMRILIGIAEMMTEALSSNSSKAASNKSK